MVIKRKEINYEKDSHPILGKTIRIKDHNIPIKHDDLEFILEHNEAIEDIKKVTSNHKITIVCVIYEIY